MKTRKSISRIAAVFLVICMIFQIMPIYENSPIVAEAAEVYTVNFWCVEPKPATIEANGWEINWEETSDGKVENNLESSAGYLKTAFNYTTERLAIDFVIPTAGLYDVSAMVLRYGNYGIDGEMFIDGELIGSFECYHESKDEKQSRDHDEQDIGQVWLDSGRHTVSFRTLQDYSYRYEYIWLEKLTFTPSEGEGPEGPGDPEEPGEEKPEDPSRTTHKVDFWCVDPEPATIAANGWEVNWEETSDGKVEDNLVSSGGYLKTAFNYTTERLAIDIEIPATGTYDLSAIVRRCGNYGIDGELFIDGELIGSFECYHESKDEKQNRDHDEQDIGQVWLEKGRHTVSFRTIKDYSYRYEYIWLEALVFTPSEENKPENPDEPEDPKPETPSATTHKVNFWCVDPKPATIAKNGWEVNWEKTSDGKVEQYLENSAGYLKTAFNYTTERIAIDFEIPATGTYDVSAIVGRIGNYGIYGKMFIDDSLVGSFECFHESKDQNKSKDHDEQAVGQIWLEKGRHTLAFATSQDYSYRYEYLYMEAVVFTPAAPAKYKVELGSAATGSSSFTDRDIAENSWVINELTSDDVLGRTGETIIYEDMLKAQMATGEIFAIDFRVPYAGKFKLDSTILPVPGYGLIGDVYVDGEYVGTLDFNEGTEKYTNSTALKAIELDGNVHTLAIKRVNTTSYDRFWICNFGFTPLDSLPTVTGVQIKAATTTVLKGETAVVKAEATMSDGSTYVHFKDNLDGSAGDSLVITSQNPDVAVIENGVITAKAVGTAVIKAVAVIDGKTYETTTKFNVIDMSEEVFTLTSDMPHPLRAGRKTNVLIQGAISNVITDLNKATEITVESDDDSIATANILYRDGKTYVEVLGVEKGNTEITVSATVNGLSDTVTFPVEITEITTVISPYAVAFGGETAFKDTTIENDGIEVDVEASTADFVDGNTTNYLDCYKFVLPKKGNTVVMRFEIPKSGSYSVDFAGYKVGAFGIVGAMYIDGEFVGEFDFEDHDNPTSDKTVVHNEHFRDVTLTAGVHELVIERVNGDTSYRHNMMWICNMKFTPVVVPATVAGIYVDCDKEKLIMGESVDASFSVRMSDGKDYHFPTVLTDSGNLSVEDVISERATYSNGVVTAGGSAGRAIFKIDAAMADGNVAGFWNIQVADGQLFDFTRKTSGNNPASATIMKDGWKVNDAKTTVNKNSSNYDLREAGFAATYEYGEVLALDLDILESGAYDVDITGSRIRELGTLADFYIDNTYLGRFDFSHPDFVSGMTEDEANALSDVTSAQFNAVELSQGVHTLYIKRVNPGSYRYDLMWLKSVVITQAEKLPEVSSITISAPSSEIALNHTLNANVEVWMSNGRKHMFGPKLDGSEDANNRLVFSSTDSNVFTVDQAGVMSGLNVGEAKLVADAYIRGNKTSGEQAFSVVNVLSVAANGIMQMERTKSAVAELTAVLDDVPCDLNDATSIQVLPDYPSRAEGFIIKDEGKVYLQITGLRAGVTGVTVTAVVNGVEGSVYVPVTVFVPSENTGDLFLDFRSGSATSPGGTADAADIAIHGWKVNYELSGKNVVKSSQWGLGGYGILAEIEYGEKLVFDFMVKKAGNYAVELLGTQIGNFGALADFYIDDVYVGRFSFSHPSDSSDDSIRNVNVWTNFNSIPLTLGTHTITLKRINEGDYRHAFLYYSGVKFTSIDGDLAFDKARAQADKTTLAVGESVNIYTDAVMTDGSVRNMGPLMNGNDDPNNKISITNSDPSVAKLEDGKITALKAGTTTIAVSATVDGVTKTENVVITVDNAKLGSVEANVSEDVYVGKEVAVNVSAKSDSEPVRDLDVASMEVSLNSEDDSIVSVDGMNIKGVGEGTTTVTATAVLNGVSKTCSFEVNVMADGLTGIKVKAMPRLIRPDSEGTQIKVEGGSFHGQVIDLTGATITYNNGNPDVIDVSDTGYVTPKALGQSVVTVTVEKDGFKGSGEITIVVTNGKVGRSLYTEEKVEAARENITKYDWARREMKAAVNAAEKYLDLEEFLWTSVTTQDLPRGTVVGYRYDPEMGICRYCGVNMAIKYGDNYAWRIDTINSPWKVQCPDCRRKFPSNDFWSFYQLGIDEYGNWSYEKSKAENQKLVDAGESGYLVNQLYPEVESVKTISNGRGLSKNETVEGWGVDDGWGYKTGYVYTTGKGEIEEAHTYVAYYNQEMMTAGLVKDALKNLGLAYMYTGDIKYGRVGAILMDRIADVYPSMETKPFFPTFANADSTTIYGKLDGCIWEYHNADNFSRYYDALYPAFDDPYVVKYLNEKAKKYNMENDKSTPELIRQNIETGVLREIFRSVKNGNIYGNFGLHQEPLAVAAVVLDTMPESKEMLDYLMAKDEKSWGDGEHTGGDIYDKFLNSVDRDGGTGEGLAPNYAALWFNSMGLIAEVLNGYKGYEEADLMKNLKYQKMMQAAAKLVMTRRSAVQAGDSGNYAGGESYLPSNVRLMQGYRASGNIAFAQLAYFQNGNKVDGLREDIFSKNPEAIAAEIQSVIDQYGEYPFDESIIMADYGFAALRDGSLYGRGSMVELDNQRDVWMQFGRSGTHGHASALNIGMHAYGIDVMPELGYPTAADGGDEYMKWGVSSIGHNLVVVDDRPQERIGNPATPMHYDDAGRVKLVDVNAPAVYSATDIYRRTLINIEANDDVAYTVDFFRVRGGDEHLYSFHSQSNDIYDYGGFTPAEYGGSYAGEDVSYHTLGVNSGYSYLTNIRKDVDPQTGEIFVDLAVTDYRKLVADSKDVHMRMTMLNDFDLSEVTFAQGETPVRENNPRWQEFVLARRSGKNLDSTFTTVLEPYKGERYITGMKQLDVVRKDGKPINTNGDVVRALQVDLVGNRTDYIVYASNNSVEYIIDGALEFQGFAGVMTTVDGQIAYNYINDGVKFGLIETIADYSGEVIDFERKLSFNNWITVNFYSDNVDLDNIVGRHMYIENDGISNGMYLIEGATDNGDGTVTLDIGDVTLIRAATNVTADSGDYTYNIAPRQWFNIPLSVSQDASPVFVPINNSAAVVGKKFSQAVSAVSQLGYEITYTATAMPRGASFNAETGVISWTPDSYQYGKHHFSILADDGVMQSTIHFEVEVFKSSSGSGSLNEGSAEITPTTPGGSGSGSAGGGGSAGGSTTPSTPETPDKPDAPETGDGTTDVPETPAEKFVDLGNHTWAKDSIYSLVDKGVVNGTSANTYAPANNIKRADFALMLVRAFGITEGEGENFADVSANKYYAEELRLAKAAGIVNGVGDDKFNPEGEITRQDMMLMLSRALDAMEVELSEADRQALADFADAAQISDYAADAVSRMVKDGIIAGANGKINPLAKATRAEIAVMLDRVLAK